MAKKSPLKTNYEAAGSYRFIDRRGEPKALYPSPSRNIGKYRPRYIQVDDTRKVVNNYTRNECLAYGRDLFTSMPDLGGALIQKSEWCAGPGAWMPIFTGADKQWADQAEEWLLEQFFPNLCVLGQNFPFTKLLYLTSLAIDVDGDSGLYLTQTRSGFPQVGLVPSHRIGSRNDNEVVKSGKYEGFRIVDGIILNDAGRPIAVRVLGETEEDDLDIYIGSIQILYEPEWADQYRGISRVGRSSLDWLDAQDIDEYTKRAIKLGASIGLISKTESGNAEDSGANLLGAIEDTDTVETGHQLQVEGIRGGEILYMKSGENETLEALKDERPSPNTEAYMLRIQKRALYSIGWPQELLDPSKIGGASVRLIQDLVRKTISNRQETLERRAKYIVKYGIAKAIDTEILPPSKDWYKWTFTKGGLISVDNGRESDIDRENLKLGAATLSEITSKKGRDWYELRQQQQVEVEDLLDRANVISKKYNISVDAALSLLQQRTPNQAPPLAKEDTSEEDVETTEETPDSEE